MTNAYKKRNLSTYITGILMGFLVLLTYNTSQAQEVFKAVAPAQAKELIRDSVDNFVSFSPVFVEGKTYLRWLVKNDRKDGVFIVERSDDGDFFEALGFKDRIATNKEVNLFYSWVDDSPPSGYAHYRIMQVGTDHTFNYSSVVKLKTEQVLRSGSNSALETEQKK